MTTLYAMTPADIHEQLEEPLRLFRTYLDRMTYTMQDIVEDIVKNSPRSRATSASSAPSAKKGGEDA